MSSAYCTVLTPLEGLNSGGCSVTLEMSKSHLDSFYMEYWYHNDLPTHSHADKTPLLSYMIREKCAVCFLYVPPGAFLPSYFTTYPPHTIVHIPDIFLAAFSQGGEAYSKWLLLLKIKSVLV